MLIIKRRKFHSFNLTQTEIDFSCCAKRLFVTIVFTETFSRQFVRAYLHTEIP